MAVIYILLPLGLVIAAAAVWAYIWATRSGQFDDLDTPALRMLHDDDDDGRDVDRDGKRPATRRPSGPDAR